jgi:hypothetical protein
MTEKYLPTSLLDVRFYWQQKEMGRLLSTHILIRDSFISLKALAVPNEVNCFYQSLNNLSSHLAF